jgi:hypothetical protein
MVGVATEKRKVLLLMVFGMSFVELSAARRMNATCRKTLEVNDE